jgi:RNA polymerase sigma-70 factor (ECF subfamily)
MSINPQYHQSIKSMEEELIWIRKAQNDPTFFAPIYTKYHDQIFRYVFQRMDDEELAFDVTSQVFVKALFNLNKYEFRGVPFASWLYRIAKSELYQSFRDRKAERTTHTESLQIHDMIAELEEDDTEEKRQKLFVALSRLKEKDLQLIELRFFEKRSFKEIGEVMRITENNAKVKAFRALEKLKVYMNSNK